MDLHSIRRVMVTGGAGFIGSHTVDLLIKLGLEVVVVDVLAPYGGGRREHVPPQVPFYAVDICAPEFGAVLAETKPDGVIHLAAQPSVKISTDQPELDLQVNGVGMLRLLQYCEQLGIHNLVFSSSGATYGTTTVLPINETTLQRPESPYGMTKLLGEQYLHYWRGRGVHSTILRYGNVYGPRQNPHGEAGVIAIFANAMLQHNSVRIDWDGEQQKDYIYVSDVALANVLALLHNSDDTFCIASGAGISVNTIYHTIAAELGYTVPIERAPKRPGDIYCAYFNCEHAANALDWRPQVSFPEGIRRTLAHFDHQGMFTRIHAADGLNRARDLLLTEQR